MACSSKTSTQDCPICLNPITDSNKCSLDCSHSFHYKCIFKWNTQHNSCPVCRDTIDKSEKEQTSETIPNIANNDRSFIIHQYLNKLTQSTYTNLNREIALGCNDCNSEQFYYCSGCPHVFCACERNHRMYNGRNPFELHPNDWDRDTSSLHYCFDCLIDRDQLVLENITEFMNSHDKNSYDRNKSIMESIHKQLYTNYTGVQQVQHENITITTMPDVDEFYEYIRQSYYPEIPKECFPTHNKEYEEWNYHWTSYLGDLDSSGRINEFESDIIQVLQNFIRSEVNEVN